MQIHCHYFSKKGLILTGKAMPPPPSLHPTILNLQGEIMLMLSSFHNNQRDQCHVLYKDIKNIYFLSWIKIFWISSLTFINTCYCVQLWLEMSWTFLTGPLSYMSKSAVDGQIYSHYNILTCYFQIYFLSLSHSLSYTKHWNPARKKRRVVASLDSLPEWSYERFQGNRILEYDR